MRVTDTELRNVVTFSSSKSSVIFIEQAELLIDEKLDSAGLSEDRLDMIALYLAAHFVTISEGGQLSSKEIGTTKETFAVRASSGLFSTQYGQQAVMLDTSGTLAEMATPKKKANFTLVGGRSSRVPAGSVTEDFE